MAVLSYYKSEILLVVPSGDGFLGQAVVTLLDLHGGSLELAIDLTPLLAGTLGVLLARQSRPHHFFVRQGFGLGTAGLGYFGSDDEGRSRF